MLSHSCCEIAGCQQDENLPSVTFRLYGIGTEYRKLRTPDSSSQNQPICKRKRAGDFCMFGSDMVVFVGVKVHACNLQVTVYRRFPSSPLTWGTSRIKMPEVYVGKLITKYLKSNQYRILRRFVEFCQAPDNFPQQLSTTFHFHLFYLFDL